MPHNNLESFIRDCNCAQVEDIKSIIIVVVLLAVCSQRCGVVNWSNLSLAAKYSGLGTCVDDLRLWFVRSKCALPV